MQLREPLAVVRFVLHHLLVAAAALGLTLGFFLVLPLMQAISAPPAMDLSLTRVDAADLPPPPPPEEEAPEEEPEPPEQTPELAEPARPLDLGELELALHPGFDGDWSSASTLPASLHMESVPSETVEALFSIADLDQRPRAVYQPAPTLDDKLRKLAPASVHVVFIVDERGRVAEPLVQDSTNPAFERAALAAVKQWQFEPGRRKGQAVRFRMRVPITFPAGS